MPTKTLIPWTDELDRILLSVYTDSAKSFAGSALDDPEIMRRVCQRLRSEPSFVPYYAMLIPSRIKPRLTRILDTDAAIKNDQSAAPPKPSRPREETPSANGSQVVEQSKPSEAPTGPDAPPQIKRILEGDTQQALILAQGAFSSLKLETESLRKELTAEIETLGSRLDKIDQQVRGLDQRLEVLERIDRVIGSLYRELTGRDEATTTSTPKEEEVVVNEEPTINPPQQPVETPPVVVGEPITISELEDLTEQEMEFRRLFAGKTLGILGGMYDEHQNRRLVRRLGVVIAKDSWLSGSHAKISNKLYSFVSPTRVDLLMVFKKSVNKGHFKMAVALSERHKIPCIETTTFDPKQVAAAFIEHGRNVKR